MLIIALVATLVALVQNLVMFAFGMKEQAIFAFPLGFTGIFLAEVVSIWAGYFCARKFLPKWRTLAMAAWVVITLGAAELVLPMSIFRMLIQHALRVHALNRIEPAESSFEPLMPDRGGHRFALTYTLRFPKRAHYLTYPAYLGTPDSSAFGYYFTKLHPEYYDEDYFFDAGKPYSFTVLFDTEGKPIDFAQEKANIAICDAKDYFMACRAISFGLEGLPGAEAANPSPVRREPAVPEDNVRDLTEKSLRLDALRLDSAQNKAGSPVGFSFVITNVGKKTLVIPEGRLANVIDIRYGYEAVSESAKATKVIPGSILYGNAVRAGGAFFISLHVSTLAPGEQIPFHDTFKPLDPCPPWAPGDYRLHVILFSMYSTERNRPVQELLADFTVVP